MTNKTLQTMKTLTEQEKMYVLTAKRQKDTGISYLCWFFFGVHYFYLNKPLTNIIYWLTLGGLGIWAIVDLFRMSSMVREYNEESMQKTVNDAKFIYDSDSVEAESEKVEEQTDWINIFVWVAILFVMCALCNGGYGFVLTLILWIVDRFTHCITNAVNAIIK